MGLDVLLFQGDKDGDAEIIKKSQRARYKSEAIVDEIQDDYKQWTRGTKSLLTKFIYLLEPQLMNWKTAKFDLDNTNKDINATQKEIGKILKAKGDAKTLIEKKTELEKRKKDLQKEVDERRAALEKKVNSVGNLVHPSVPISNDEVWLLICCLANVRRIMDFSNVGIQMAHLL
jgi:seryl-tRNA synthetase